MDKKWPLRPKPLAFQLLYRWIEQLAEAYGVSYRCFCKNVLELTHEEISALSKILPQKALLILSKGTGIPFENLCKRDLDTTFKILHEELSRRMEAHPEFFDKFLVKTVHKT